VLDFSAHSSCNLIPILKESSESYNQFFSPHTRKSHNKFFPAQMKNNFHIVAREKYPTGFT
jgi:hypothetical protein